MSSKQNSLFHSQGFGNLHAILNRQFHCTCCHYHSSAISDYHAYTRGSTIFRCCTINVYLMQTRWRCTPPNLQRLLPKKIDNCGNIIVIKGSLCSTLDMYRGRTLSLMSHLIPIVPNRPRRDKKYFQVMIGSSFHNS